MQTSKLFQWRAVWNSLLGLEFADDPIGSGFRDQVAFDFELEALFEERSSLLAGYTQDGGIVGRAPVGVREPYPHEFVSGLGFTWMRRLPSAGS